MGIGGCADGRRDPNLENLESKKSSYVPKSALGPVYASFTTIEETLVGELRIPQDTEFLYFGKAGRQKNSDIISFEGYRVELGCFRRLLENEVKKSKPLVKERLVAAADGAISSIKEERLSDATPGYFERANEIHSEVDRAAVLAVMNEIRKTDKVRKIVYISKMMEYRELDLKNEIVRAELEAAGLLEKAK